MNRIKVLIAVAMQEAAAGVDYTLKDGAACPFCGCLKIKVVTTRPWDGAARIRYHKCKNKSCPLCKNKTQIKSIQTE